MTSAYILIAAVLLLGGILAALGDRLGSKVGKARLRLFNLRPRQTAIVVTVMTGTAIAATTLGILFGTSKSLRQGIFILDDILRDLRIARSELASIREEKQKVEKELKSDQIKRAAIQNRLKRTDESYKQAQAQVQAVSKQANTLKNEIKKLLGERQKLVDLRQQLAQQIAGLKTQLEQRDKELVQKDKNITKKNQDLTGLRQERQQLLNDRSSIQQELNSSQQELAGLSQERQQLLTERNTLQTEINSLQSEVTQRDETIEELDRAIAFRDRTLRERKIRLEELRAQIEIFEANYLALRQGNVAIARGQTLAFGVVRIVDPQRAREAVEELLRQANRNAIQITNPGNNGLSDERVVRITQLQVNSIVETIQDGQDYVIRLVAAENYVQGEQRVQVFADIAINEEIFVSDEVVAEVPINPSIMSEQEIEKRLDLLLTQSQTRARRAGLLGKIQVEDGNIVTLINFIEQLKDEQQPFEEIAAIASQLTYSSGPLILRLVALHNGKVVFSS